MKRRIHTILSNLFLHLLGIVIGLCLRYSKGETDEDLHEQMQERLWQESDWAQ